MKTLLTLITITFLYSSHANASEKNKVTWEYKVVILSTGQATVNKDGKSLTTDDINQNLTALGKQKWELISILPIEGEVNRALYYFKRPNTPSSPPVPTR
ncbi:DUF4177 domain-containing protein [Rubritalea sp.]|uniref:DUF4177 domain-containing protein n=1 Tax=Rubritalea sp. TaxID=2109375 RepID=UPI003EF82BD5